MIAMNIYLNEQQKQLLSQFKTHFHYRTEWPTFVLIVTIYSTWLSTLIFWEHLGSALSCVILALITSWYMSLQHELLHGHPTRWDALNRLFGLFPFAVFYPYDLYKQQHLLHHQDAQLTDPVLDTQSNYIDVAAWQNLSTFYQFYYWSNRTLLGRMILGPLFSIIFIFKHLFKAFVQFKLRDMWMWTQHVILLGTLFYLLANVFHFPVGLYFLSAYFALSIALIRSFYEHRPAITPEHRTVINEAEIIFRILFLDNNYHLIHHDLPHVPWFYLRKVFLQHKYEYIERNHAFYYTGYLQIFRKNHVVPIDSPIYQHASEQLKQQLHLKTSHEQ